MAEPGGRSNERLNASRAVSAASSARGGPGLEAALAQCAGRTAAAAVSPRMARAAAAEVAGVGLFDDELHQRIAAEVLRELPGRRLVDPHERRLDGETPRHPERQRHLRRL